MMVVAFVVYCGLCAVGRAPQVRGLKHNQLCGPFLARYVVWFIGPVERLLVGRVSPNSITAVSLLMCAGTGVAAGVGALGAAVWLYALGGILDILDGRLARLSGKQTASGALFDSVSDRWGELFVFTGFAWYLRDTAWLLAVMAAIGSSMMVSYTRARAEGLGIELSGGLMQRSERILVVAFGAFFAAWYGASPEHADKVAPILGGAMLLCGAASTATAVNRWIVAYRVLARRDAEHVAEPAVEAAPLAATDVPSDRYVPVPAKLRESAELGV
jgi:phosphatidylglycerophosphate synthase